MNYTADRKNLLLIGILTAIGAAGCLFFKHFYFR